MFPLASRISPLLYAIVLLSYDCWDSTVFVYDSPSVYMI